MTSGRVRKSVFFRPKSLICAGFAGRDQEKVREHIAELAKIGVSPPPETPTAYRVPTSLLTTANEIDVGGRKTSGEVEYVILKDGNGMYVTVGSDHTDRELEGVDIQKSKLACQKVMAPEVWSYDDLESHWDALELRSQVDEGGGTRDYQAGRLSELMLPLGLMHAFNATDYGTVIFSGTIPLKGEISFSDRFEMTLADPVLKRRISHGYSVRISNQGVGRA